MPRFLTKAFVLHLHEWLIDLFGGSPGLRDEGLLESALAQPEASFGGVYLHEDLASMAAAYAFHLANNHPFVDGNKRVAAAAMGTFLEANGRPLTASEVELYQAIIAVASGELDKDGLIAWVRLHTASSG